MRDGLHGLYRSGARARVTAVEEGYRAGSGLRMMASAADAHKRAFVEVDAPQLLSMRQVVIDRIEPEADGVVSLILTDPDGVLLPAWTPGAHLDVVLPSGRRRQYSLNSDPADRGRYRIAVRRIADGAGSREIHQRLRAGDRLSVRAVRNTFPLSAAQQYLFVAGGIGIAPILSLVHAAESAGTPWRLMYFGRSRARMPFLCELARLTGGDVVVRPDDEFGRPNPRMIFEQTPTGATVYVCAPPPLAESARQVLSLHDPTAALYTERFAPVS